MGLFEGDRDLGMIRAFDVAIKRKAGELQGLESLRGLELSKILHAQDKEMDEAASEVRSRLDADDQGVGLLRSFRALEFKDKYEAKYSVILLSALMMLVGARIPPHDLQGLRELVPEIHCDHGYALCLHDTGFWDPGRAQFLDALDHYQPGVPRDFVSVPSCFHCGKIKADTGREPLRCAGCQRAWYCDKVGPSR